MLYLHGGGYTCGNIDFAIGFASTLAKSLGLRVFAPAYRLAPEAPYPAAVDDALRAYEYLIECGISPRSIILCGESAGGGLSYALCLRLRKLGLPIPAGIIAISPCGENAALANLTVVKQPQTSGTVRGESVANMNVGKTMWLCTDSTGTDQANAIPYFSLQNYSGVGSGLSRYAPANLSIRNQGEGGLATNANAHRNSCLLKPGDYLYVEYGHNESGVTSYTNNLETYLADVNTAGAYLVIVSPVERRTSWNSGTSTWDRSLQGIAEAGEAWVEDKIAQGARNVAFIDLNMRYNDWMNTELQRIHTVNSDVSLNAAISYYYRSAKGANVDNTHINNAGTDQAAYWVWYDALARVAAGENAAEGSAAKVQADVLKGITEGYQPTRQGGTFRWRSESIRISGCCHKTNIDRYAPSVSMLIKQIFYLSVLLQNGFLLIPDGRNHGADSIPAKVFH